MLNKPNTIGKQQLPWMGELYHANHHWNPGDPRFGLLDGTYYFMIKWAEMLVPSQKTVKKS